MLESVRDRLDPRTREVASLKTRNESAEEVQVAIRGSELDG
jgi:hypothetical protein